MTVDIGTIVPMSICLWDIFGWVITHHPMKGKKLMRFRFSKTTPRIVALMKFAEDYVAGGTGLLIAPRRMLISLRSLCWCPKCMQQLEFGEHRDGCSLKGGPDLTIARTSATGPRARLAEASSWVSGGTVLTLLGYWQPLRVVFPYPKMIVLQKLRVRSFGDWLTTDDRIWFASHVLGGPLVNNDGEVIGVLTKWTKDGQPMIARVEEIRNLLDSTEWAKDPVDTYKF